MRYYIIAGERSGDLHGSNLINAIRTHDPAAVFRGFGGDFMKEAGLDLVVHYEQMAFMGLKALVTNAWTIYQKIKFCKEDISAFKPDVIILIDYGGFNRRIAKFGKKDGLKVFYYIPPKVWAWYTSRAWELKANVDRMFVILPFEKAFYKKFDFDVDYVGNPVLDSVKAFQPDPDFLKKYEFTTGKTIVALLPGSRKMELKKIVPLMAAVVRANPQYQFAVAAIQSLPPELYTSLREIASVKFIFDGTYDLLSHASAAIVTSGTATLETGLFKVPQVVVYKAGKLELAIIRSMVKVTFISLVNLIADKQVVKELIQEQATPDHVNAELKKLVEKSSYRKEMLLEYDSVYKILDTGSASENTARLMVTYLTH
ncbi:MAG TPA: lipid-A-disaccharide synthase [Cyclobacteriaceae bacterium]|nr:lipid-A-disaccharide synthase [Cyclobacteriaceae bacterium]